VGKKIQKVMNQRTSERGKTDLSTVAEETARQDVRSVADFAMRKSLIFAGF
jgi:hypothetical protein